METPEPVENARERFGDLDYDVDDRLSHVILSEPITTYNRFTEETTVHVPAGERLKFSRLEHYDGEWTAYVYYEGDGHDIYLSEHDVEWVYDSDVPEKAEQAEELLSDAQSLLDDIWGETGNTTAEELTKRVQQTRNKLNRRYL